MKILMVALGIFHAKGGIEKFNQRVLRVLSKQADSGLVEKVTVVSLWDQQEDLDNHFPNLNTRGFNRSKIQTIRAFIYEILKHDYDLILYAHVLLYPLIFLSVFFSWKSRRVLFVHGREVWEKPVLVEKEIISKLTHRIIAVSQYTIRRMASVYGIDMEKFKILPNAIDFKELSEPFHLDNNLGFSRLLSVSRLSISSRHKNIDKVIISLMDVLEHYPAVRYTIVGDGDWKPELIALSKNLNLSDKVIFTGRIGDGELAKQYQSADLFILPSTREGFGIVFLEAWQHQLPVITSNQGAAPEVVRNGVDGLCVEPTPSEIARAINELLSNKEKAQKMGSSGYARLKENFSHAVFENRLIEILFNGGS